MGLDLNLSVCMMACQGIVCLVISLSGSNQFSSSLIPVTGAR